MFIRNNLLKEMRQSVIDVTVSTGNGGHTTGRFTLRPDLLPPNFDMKIEEDFHEKNANIIAAWNVRSGGWYHINIDDVKLTQDVSETY